MFLWLLYKCVISTFIHCAALHHWRLCLLFVCLSFCFWHWLFVCFFTISACPYVLWLPSPSPAFPPPRSVSGRRLSQGSPPRLPALPRQQAALPLPLCSPPVWPFTASSVCISTAAPPPTKDYSRSTGKGTSRPECVTVTVYSQSMSGNYSWNSLEYQVAKYTHMALI